MDGSVLLDDSIFSTHYCFINFNVNITNGSKAILTTSSFRSLETSGASSADRSGVYYNINAQQGFNSFQFDVPFLHNTYVPVFTQTFGNYTTPIVLAKTLNLFNFTVSYASSFDVIILFYSI